MRTAYEKGFNVITLTDCVGATSEEILEATVKINYPLYSYPMTHSEFINLLEGKESRNRDKSLQVRTQRST
jgi:nicotinamidase-related amidase